MRKFAEAKPSKRPRLGGVKPGHPHRVSPVWERVFQRSEISKGPNGMKAGSLNLEMEDRTSDKLNGAKGRQFPRIAKLRRPPEPCRCKSPWARLGGRPKPRGGKTEREKKNWAGGGREGAQS